MKKLLNVLRTVREFIEMYFPIVCFVVLFVLFLMQVIVRYVVISNYSTAWTQELCQACYTWMTLLGALYVERKGKHVKFTLLYDAVPPVVGEILHIIGYLLITVVFAASFVPTVKYVMFMKVQSTPVLHIKLSLVYSVYIVFMIGMVLYQLANICEAVKNIINHNSLQKTSRLKGETGGEYQE